VQKPFALSFQVPALALPDCSSGSRVIFPSGVKVILNFAPEGDTAVNGCPVKKVAFISFGAIGSAAKAALALKTIILITSRPTRGTQKSPFPLVCLLLHSHAMALGRRDIVPAGHQSWSSPLRGGSGRSGGVSVRQARALGSRHTKLMA
jgi:hypothetical protein